MSMEECETLSQLGVSLHKSGRYREAAEIQREALAGDPENAYFHYRLSESLDALGNGDEAFNHIEIAARNEPAFPLFRDVFIRRIFDRVDAQSALSSYLEMSMRAPSRFTEDLDSVAGVLLMERREVDLCWKAFAPLFGWRARDVKISDQDFGPQSIQIEFRPDGHRIEISSSFLFWGFLIQRLFAMREAFDAVDVIGTVRFSLGDEADGDDFQLCFSSDSPKHVPVPDAIFFESKGYEHFRNTPHKMPWVERRPQAYWRGSLTGRGFVVDEIMALPRVKICLASRFSDHINAKLTDFSQYNGFKPDLRELMTGLSVVGDREPAERNLEYRYLIDVDGNTNAWQSLFMKLLFGGTIIKLRSDYRQWYYDRIQHKETVYLIDSARELEEAVVWGESNPTAMEDIAMRSLELGRSMTVQSEIKSFVKGVRDCIALG